MSANGRSSNSSTVQSVTIESFVERATPAPEHIAYVIVVKLPVQSWRILRRYSDFASLEKQLQSQPAPQGAGRAAPAQLPPKRAVQHTLSILSRSNTISLQKQLAEGRLPELRAWLKAILDSQDPIWRSSYAFRQFLELPKDAQFQIAQADTSGYSSSSASAGARSSSQASSSMTKGESHAAARTSSAPHSSGGIRRLGARSMEVRETDDTRALDNPDLLASQAAQMDAQDQQLGRLANVLRRQREIGLAINHELAEQSELLQQLDTEVVVMQEKVCKGEDKMKRLGG
ncbi:hypothetical protein K437DRAFT_149682 [Tilletiaria anomala UBC 951]|uniref:Phox-like protein n=1 Tax=Tilletiaria anomala (strain ATCC 24038 / CBS 436.72 / UBC 951) TaxID=1037660 RepID=A0A066WFX8_TILAU|nr:uncharacterized protein K437DRAFT_149682 [Tilletiaria anomala UBC 951]KDN52842.1 hypothetical protein K437DRAFT_149682 [Tilletiaria anomala UBC 951]